MAMNTYEELTAEMNRISEIVISNVSDAILKNLKEIIKRDVYDSHGPNSVYRDFSESASEFYNAWEWGQIKKSTKEISRVMFYNWQKMSVDPSPGKYIHTDYVTLQDTRSRLADILNVNGLDNGVGSGNPLSVQRYAYFNNFIADMTLGGEVLSLLDREFGKFGIKR